MQFLASAFAKAKRLVVLLAVLVLLGFGIFSSAMAISTAVGSPAYGHVLTEEDGGDSESGDNEDSEEGDDGEGNGKKGASTKKKIVTGGIGATFLLIVGVVVRQIRRAYKVYKFGRSAYKTGKFAHNMWRRRQQQQPSEPPSHP